MAKDLAQEAFLRGFENYGSLADKRKVLPWLKTIARNIYYRYLNNTKMLVSLYVPVGDSEEELVIGDMLQSDMPEIEESVAKRELCDRILQEIGKLSEKQKGSVLLRYYQGFSVKDTAAMLKTSENSIKVSGHLGLEKIKQALFGEFVKGGYIMDCKEAYTYLLQYAKWKI